MKYDFAYHGKVVTYEIIYKDVKNLNIRVTPDGKVFVSCNKNIDNATIEIEMTRHAKWLFKTLDAFNLNLIEFNNPDLRFIDGEAFQIFGRILQIKNVQSNNFEVSFDNNYLYIYRPNQKGVKQKFNKWYKEYVLSCFDKMVESIWLKYKNHGIEKPKVVIKNMKTQWGSCNIQTKTITLNSQLAKVDKFLTEYVICHELTHFKYKNHNVDFYAFLTTMVPDWKQREKILNKIFINQKGEK